MDDLDDVDGYNILALFSGFIRMTLAGNFLFIGYTSCTALSLYISFRCIKCIEPCNKDPVNHERFSDEPCRYHV